MNHRNEYEVLSDDGLVSYLRNGDENAFIEIYNRYKAGLHLHAYQKLGDFEKAKEVVQAIFLTCWQKHEDIPQAAKISTHLYNLIKAEILAVIADLEDISVYASSFDQFQDQEKSLLR